MKIRVANKVFYCVDDRINSYKIPTYDKACRRVITSAKRSFRRRGYDYYELRLK